MSGGNKIVWFKSLCIDEWLLVDIPGLRFDSIGEVIDGATCRWGVVDPAQGKNEGDTHAARVRRGDKVAPGLSLGRPLERPAGGL